MKKLLLILMAVPLLMCGCKAKRLIVIKENTATSLIDTSQCVIDTIGAVFTHTDTTKTIQSIEQQVEVEFVDGGGTVCIDTAGNVTIQGIKGINGKGKAKALQLIGTTNTASTVQSHRGQASGITKNETRQSQTEEKPSRAIRWYEKPLIWIGSLCCIAVLLWLIFIYIHKKH